ncbi:MAG: ATP-binding cassette domain-containing protein [Alphaproteobacteria bacterium]
MEASGDVVILAEKIGRKYGRKWALRHVDLCVERGQIFGLVGPDGAGKTTLLQLLAAILDPTEGMCRVLGFDAKRQSSQITSRIGYMAQGFTLYHRLTVAENLTFAARAHGVPAAGFADRHRRLLAMAGLEPFLHRPEGKLSGGMRKKLALCTNLIHEPPLLLLDEPGLGVDPISRRELWQMLEEYRRAGTSIVLATSYMDEAERCDRLAFLEAGGVIAHGSPDELRARVTGAVYQARTDRPEAVEQVLSQSTAVASIQWRPGGIRFGVRPGSVVDAGLRQRLEAVGRLDGTKPSLEDTFALFAQGDKLIETASAGKLAVMPSTPESPATGLETDGLTRRFGDFVAVDHATLHVGEGEIFGLLGANGAGKTTLIRMLCGLLPPSSGEASVAGVDVRRQPRRLRQLIGYMSQRFSLYPDLTIEENLRFFASAYGLRGGNAGNAIAWARETMRLASMEDRPAGQLSGAMRQRLALACSLLHKPRVLFLDEPTSGVDPITRHRFWRLIARLAAGGTTIVVTTHYLEEANYCHRLGFMHRGSLIALGDLPTLRAGIANDVPNDIESIFLAYMDREQTRSSEGSRQAV